MTSQSSQTPQNSAEVRQQVNTLFDDSKLDAFCLDNFQTVYDKFSGAMGKDRKITLLLDHCRRDSGRWNKLLHLIQGLKSNSSNLSPSSPKNDSRLTGNNSENKDSSATIVSPQDIFGFKYSCFISYRGGQEELTLTFIEELTRALKSYLEPFFDMGVFVDDQQMQGGDLRDKRLANALCQSVCMIQVFTPKYFSPQKLSCTREFMAMEILEQGRFAAVQLPQSQQTFSFIIPVVFRGADRIPREIQKKGRLYYDFSKYTLVQPQISNNASYVDSINQIARRVYDLYEEFSQYDQLHDCAQFTLPSEEEAHQWLKRIKKSRQPIRFSGR